MKKKNQGEQTFVDVPARAPAGPQHGTDLNPVPTARKEPAFRDLDCREIWLNQNKKATSGESPLYSVLHLGRIESREDARGSLTLCNRANEVFGSKSLQTSSDPNPRFPTVHFTRVCGISFHLVLLLCLSRIRHGNLWG